MRLNHDDVEAAFGKVERSLQTRIASADDTDIADGVLTQRRKRFLSIDGRAVVTVRIGPGLSLAVSRSNSDLAEMVCEKALAVIACFRGKPKSPLIVAVR